MPTPRIIPTGERHGRLTVIIDRQANERVQCVCDCGQPVSLGLSHWGRTESCGCLQRERTREALTTHGMHDSSEYRIWTGMWTRCTNPRSRHYRDYGGRGITVCDAWRDFAAFYTHVGPRPSLEHSIDRIDNGRGYEPGNVRWATQAEQNQNQRPRELSTHCAQGHEFTPENTRVHRGSRHCRTCDRAYFRARRAARALPAAVSS